MRTMRRIGLIVLGCVLATVLVLVELIVWLGRVAGSLAWLTIAVAVIATYVSLVGPWQRRWGATDREVARQMPGDDLLRSGAPSTTRAIGIGAAPDVVFPWLLQIGYGRGGWYSYDWIDNDGRPSVERIDPGLQRLAVGDRIEMVPGFGPVVVEIVPDHHILAAGETDTWCLQVEPVARGGCRLVSRWRQDWPPSLGASIWSALADPGSFLMEQRMLRRIRDLAERRPADVRLAGSQRIS
jgi:hypothetical protein